MDLHEIQELTNLVKESNIHELEIERGDMRLKIVNQCTCSSTAEQKTIVTDKTFHTQTISNNTEHSDQISKTASKSAACDKDCHIVKSPIVGTFYSAPSPEAPNFVEVGSPVDTASTVCIIEAMKVMNEIQAEIKGTIEEIFVENAQPVEFGQPLFKIRKS